MPKSIDNPGLNFSKEEIKYLVDSMDCLRDESSGYRNEYDNMITKLDKYARSNLNCFINRNGKILNLSEEAKDKEESERFERNMAMINYAAQHNLASAYWAIEHLKTNLASILDLDGKSLIHLTDDKLRYMERSIEYQWNAIFAGYPRLQNLVTVHISEQLPDSYEVKPNPFYLTRDELETIFFPKYLIEEIDSISL